MNIVFQKLENYNLLSENINNKSELAHEHSISEVRELQSIITTLTETIRSKSDREHEHNISEVRELQSILNNKSDLDHTHGVEDLREVITTVIQGIPTISTKGLIYLDHNNIIKNTNAEIVKSEDPNVVDKVIKTKNRMAYDIRFQIPKEKLCLGSSVVKLRGKTNRNLEDNIVLKIYAVNNFNTTSDRQTWSLLDSNIAVKDFNTKFTDKYNTFDMKLLSKDTVGIEILVEHKHNNTDYLLELDHILIMPALPGVFMS